MEQLSNSNNNANKYLVNLVLDLPLDREFTYSCETQLTLGQRVLVEFINKQVVGFVWRSITELELDCSIDKIKPVINIYPEVIPSDVLQLIKFTAKYYHYPIGQVFFTAVPSLLRKPIFIHLDTEKYIKLIRRDHEVFKKRMGLKQQELYSKLQDSILSYTQIKEILGITYKKLIEKWLSIGVIGYCEGNISTLIPKISNKLPLNTEQCDVVNQISQNLAKFSPAVLYGITGSGKTEVYLELIENVILLGKQVLVLVPEINLTPQLLDRFKRRFNNMPMHILTSNVSEKERVTGYIEASLHTKQIIIGTRMAVFTPFKNLGLIIVDEEHDSSFKQNEGLRYNARDLAVYRANYFNIPIILGSATPSLETLYNFKLKRFALYKLTGRAVAGAVLPEIKLLDLNTIPANNGLTDNVVKAIQSRFINKELSLIYINRRGYAPVISCYECGWVSSCKNCSSNMVYHNKEARLKCHHCGLSYKLPSVCPKCGSKYIQAIGQGTQKIEETLAQIFPEARVLRIDQDTTNSKLAWDNLYAKVHNNEVDILIGTQMLTKGHDFHNLTLVVGLNLDSGLYSYDFRATEFLFTQLMQVSGRAGRGLKKGEVLLQTHYPRHELYQYLIKHDFAGFANFLLKERKGLTLPPYTFYVLIRASSNSLDTTMAFLTQVHELLIKNSDNSTIIYHPVASVMQRLKNKERGQILLSNNKRKELHDYLAMVLPLIEKLKHKSDILWHVDIDPTDM